MVKNFLKKYSIIIFLSFIVILMTVVKVLNKGIDQNFENKQINQEINNSITLTPTPFPKTETDSFDPEAGYSYNMFLPYEGEKIRIEKYIEPYVLEVIIKKEANKIDAENEVIKWLKENEISNEKTSYIFKIED